MEKSKQLWILFIFSPLFAIGQPTTSPLQVSDADVTTVNQAIKMCGDGKHPTAHLVDQGQLGDKGFSYHPKNHIPNLAYTPAAWKAIVSAARTVKDKGWVVLGDNRHRVVTSKEWEEKHKDSECYGSFGVDCDLAVRFGKMVVASPMASATQSGLTFNCMNNHHATMIKTLLDNGYQYNKEKDEWTKSESNTESKPGDALQ